MPNIDNGNDKNMAKCTTKTVFSFIAWYLTTVCSSSIGVDFPCDKVLTTRILYESVTSSLSH